MTPQFQKISVRPQRSFVAEECCLPRFDSPWHYHPEFELTYIVSSSGYRMIGDSMEPFHAGDLVLLGEDIPHVWQNTHTGPGPVPSVATVIQFRREFLGRGLWDSPEMCNINKLLNRASRGLSFPTSCSTHVADDIRRLPGLRGITGLTSLLNLLERLAAVSAAAKPLCSLNYAPVLKPDSDARINRVFDFATRRLHLPLSVSQLAQVAAMTPPAFSRYFKRATGRNPSDFITDLRIEKCASLLRESDLSVTEIAGRTGFTTLTSFNRRFKERMHTTPRAYRKAFSDS
jgi:AraC-like DNA-binding protein